MCRIPIPKCSDIDTPLGTSANIVLNKPNQLCQRKLIPRRDGLVTRNLIQTALPDHIIVFLPAPDFILAALYYHRRVFGRVTREKQYRSLAHTKLSAMANRDTLLRDTSTLSAHNHHRLRRSTLQGALNLYRRVCDYPVSAWFPVSARRVPMISGGSNHCSEDDEIGEPDRVIQA